MPAYVIIEIKVKDRDTYAEYVKRVPATVKQYGGRYLARGGEVTPLVGDWYPERIILLEFASVGQVQRWRASPDYQQIAPLRERSTIGRAIIVEGLPDPGPNTNLKPAAEGTE